MDVSRRGLLVGAALLALPGCALSRRRSRETRVALLGQSLIKHDLCAQLWPEREDLAERLSRFDAVFSDLEVAIRGPRAGTPTREALTLHTAEPSVIDCLSSVGVNLLATSNNHAFDLNTGGIVDAIDALRSRRIAFAGTGMNIAGASDAAVLSTPGRPVALVAFATGRVREGGMATPERPGVAEIRRSHDGTLNPEDVERTLAAIRRAAAGGALVIAYQHNHYWEDPNWITPQWQRTLARACVDSGAALFVAHGTPLLQGIEMYRGKPLFHGLGSFIFQTIKEEGAYDELAWQSLIVECRFDGERFAGARLIPVQLNAVGTGGPDDLATRGRPRIASPAEARVILDRLAFLSERLGHRLDHDGRTARLLP
jgi:poly-gamma-glutamate capsule biosynthesis protein CapA/YwtB (metallophosphatase superfamily)